MVEWTTGKLAGLIIAIIVLIVIIYFIYAQVGGESSIVTAVNSMWDKYMVK